MLDSVTDLRSLLKDPSLLCTKAYVAGEWVDADDGTTFAVANPARGDVICHRARTWAAPRPPAPSRPPTSARRRNGPPAPARNARRSCASGST